MQLLFTSRLTWAASTLFTSGLTSWLLAARLALRLRASWRTLFSTRLRTRLSAWLTFFWSAWLWATVCLCRTAVIEPTAWIAEAITKVATSSQAKSTYYE